MIWDELDWDQMTRRIFAEVWRTMRLACAWPRSLKPAPAHTPAPRGKTLPLPLPRSWLGGRYSDPLMSRTHSLKGATMRKLPIILPAVGLALLSGLAVGTLAPSASPAPSVTWSAPPVLTQAVACAEDDPCWDCHSMGNRVCGPASDAERAAAWAAWDYSHGAASLKVDPSRAYRVEYVGSALDTPRSLADNEGAVVGKDGKWYVFRANYTR